MVPGEFRVHVQAKDDNGDEMLRLAGTFDVSADTDDGACEKALQQVLEQWGPRQTLAGGAAR